MSEPTGPTGHDAVRELLALDALDALDALSPEERHALDVHLTTCDECRRELAALRDGVASIAASLPARAMVPERAAAMRARLMARAIDDRTRVTPIRAPMGTTGPPTTGHSPRRPTRLSIPSVTWTWRPRRRSPRSMTGMSTISVPKTAEPS